MNISTALKDVLRPLYHQLSFPLVARHLKQNVELRDRYAGQRCFVLCTGASLSLLDFSLIRNELVIACNFVWMHPQFADLKNIAAFFLIEPASSFKDYYYYCVRHNFWPTEYKNAKGPYDVLREISNALAEHSGLPIILNAVDVAFMRRHRMFGNCEQYFVRARTKFGSTPIPSYDMASNFTFLDGSVYAMLGGALYLGFKEIYLVGAGYTFAPQQQGHFYDDFTETSNEGIDPKHERVKQIAAAAGATIYNLLPEQFTSPVYPGVYYAELPARLMIRGTSRPQ